MILSKFLPKRLGTQLSFIVGICLLIAISLFSYQIHKTLVSREHNNLLSTAKGLGENIALAANHFLPISDLTSIEFYLINTMENFAHVNEIMILDLQGNTQNHVVRSQSNISSKYNYTVAPTPKTIAYHDQWENNHIIIWQPINIKLPIGWVKLTISSENIVAIKRQINRQVFSFAFLTMLVCFSVTTLFIHNRTKEIKKAVKAANQLSSASTNIKFSSSKELEDLGLALSDVSQKLERQNSDLAKNEFQLRSVLNHTKEIIFGIDKKDNCTFANRACLNFFRIEQADSILHKPLSLSIPKEFQILSQHRIDDIFSINSLNDKIEQTFDCVSILTPEQGILFYEVSLHRISQQRGCVVTLFDITARMNFEQELLKNRELLQEAQSISRMGSWSKDFVSGEFTSSKELTKLFNIQMSPREMSYKTLFNCIYFEDQERVKQQIDQAVSSADHFVLEYRVTGKDDELLYFQEKGKISRNEMGEASRISSTIHDITESKKLGTLKNRFFSMIKHELRTPLTSIHGSIKLLANGTVGDLKSKELITIADNNCSRMTNLIDDILDVEKIESGEMAFIPKKYNIINLIHESIELNKDFAWTNNIKISLQQLDMDTITVIIDSDRFLQVFNYLISNAIKFSPHHGSIDISCSCMQAGIVRIAVKDHRRAVKEEFEQHLFDKFIPEDPTTQTMAGTGLGLNISYSIVKRMGGNIGYQKSQGGGVTFYIEFPVVDENTELPKVI